MFARPKPGEDEDDILSMQEAYLKEKEKNKDFEPSAKVVNLRKHKSPEQSPIQSKFAQNKKLAKKIRVSFNEEATVIDDVSAKENDIKDEGDKVNFPTLLPSVLGDIVEKNYDDSYYAISSSSKHLVGGFPSPKKQCEQPETKMECEVVEKSFSSSPNLPSTSKVMTPSNYFQEKLRSPPAPRLDDSGSNLEDSLNTDADSETSKMSSDSLNMSMESAEDPVDTEKFFEKSAVLKGKNCKEIHSENVKRLKNMPQEEILKEREDLLTSIDPKLLGYIKSLRAKKSQDKKEPVPPVENKILEEVKYADEEESGVVSGLMQCNEIIRHPDMKNWVHFDTLEADKLQWIQNMNEYKENVQNPTEPYEARFDFKGYLLPYSMEYTEKTKTLFHHGEEPHRPGYTLNELFLLARSTVTQQRVLALNTIAGILEYHSLGVYEDVIEIPITKIYFVLRFALDENIPVIIEAVLKGLRNMFYNRIDEACLDLSLCMENGLIQPRLVSIKSEKNETESDVSELKDFHVVDLDLVSGALRTDLIPRLRYILNTVKPPFMCIEYIIQILTRIFRDSLENAQQVFNTDGLMDCIIEHYLPKNISDPNASVKGYENCRLLLTCLKMVRISICQCKSVAELYCTKYDIFARLLNYIGNVVVENTIILKIQIETFYLWSCFLHYGLGFEALLEIKGLLLRVLDNHAKETDLVLTYPMIMHSHVASLFTLLTYARLGKEKYPNALPNSFIEDFIPIALLAFKKWAIQLDSLTKCTAGHLKSISSLLTFMSTNHALEFDKFDKIPDIYTYVKQTFKSEAFFNLSFNLVCNSNLLSPVQTESYVKKMKETNTVGLCASQITKTENVLPIVTVNSSICFMLALAKYVLITRDRELHFQFFRHNIIIEYIKEVSEKPRLNLIDNWFTKLEYDFLLTVMNMALDLKISDPSREIVYCLAYKLLSMLTEEYKPKVFFLLQQIIFNRFWFATERCFRYLNMRESFSILDSLPKLFEFHRDNLNLESFENSNTLTVTNWTRRALSKDWMFIPILNLYSKSQEFKNQKDGNEISEESMKDVLMKTLEWIYIFEIIFPDLANQIHLTDRFCRLCCVFLLHNSMFLDTDIKPMLKKCFKLLFDIENSCFWSSKFDFDRPVLGLSSFEDFYKQLIEQFQAVSYGDHCFAACVLVPQARKHNIKWRYLLWSEYAACLRFLDCPKDYLCYKMEKYLEPPERDPTLVISYNEALVGNLLRENTVVYDIAKSHVDLAKIAQKLMREANANMHLYRH